MFGGKADNDLKLNDLWLFSLTKQSWQSIDCTDEVVPSVRSGHTCCLFGDLMLVFGGIFEVTREINDTFAFSFEQRRWV